MLTLSITTLNKNFKVVVTFFKGYTVAQGFEEGVIGRKYFVAQLLCSIKQLYRVKSFYLVSLVDFEKRFETCGTTEEIPFVK